MKQMTMEDATWLHILPRGESMHVTMVSVYEPGERGAVTREELEALVEDRVISHVAVFRQRLKQIPLQLDFPYWVDDPDLDLERQVRVRSVATPGDWRALLDTAVAIHAEPLDMHHQLWDFTLVTGLDHVEGLPEGSFAVVYRFHHAMVDGKSIMEVMRLLHNTSAGEGTPARKPSSPKPERGPSPVAVAYRATAHAVVHPLDMLAGVASSLPALGLDLLRRRALPRLPGGGAPRTRFNGEVSKQRHIAFVEFELDRIRSLRASAPGSKLNDVALTIIGGAMRAYLDELGELPSESLVTMCPISVRGEPSAEPTLAIEPELGNQVAIMLVPLRTDVADPVQRLRAIAAATSEAKAAQHAVPAKLLTNIQSNMQATAAAAVARLSLLAAGRIVLTNTIVSNVPGPPETVFLAGRRMRKNLGVVPLNTGIGLVHLVTSYEGMLAINVVADTVTMPDAEHYEERLRASLAELERTAPRPEKPLAR